MNNDNGRIYYGTGIDNTQMRADAAESRRILRGITDSAVNEGKQLDEVFGKVGKTIAGVFAVSQMKQFASQVVTVRGEMQKLEIAFETMIGSADEANALMSQLDKMQFRGGLQNLLPLPPNEFILQETTRVRQSQGLDAQGALHMLSQWKVRKCITNHHYRKNRTTELILTRTDKRKIYPS